MNFRNDIQGLRGIAVLLVVFYHLYPKIISGGFIGVDVFFVISGFLVCYSIENKIKNQKNKFFVTFYAARIRRLFPASYLTLFLTTVYTYKYDFTYFSVYKNDAISSLLVFANYNFYFNKVDYFHAGLKESPLLHFWSLSLEEQFYIVAPIFVWISYNNVMLLYIFTSIISLLICIYYGMKDKNKGYFFLSSRSWEFICGALVRYIPKNDKYGLCYNSNISVSLMILLSIYYNDKIIYPSYYAILPIFLSFNTLSASKQFNLISNKIIIIIGNLSYSIYLIHFPLKTIVTNSMLNYYITLITSVILSYNLVEIPFYKGNFALPNYFAFTTIFIFVLYFMLLIKDLSRRSEYRVISKHSSIELIKEIRYHLRMYCCINKKKLIHKFSILFIGDSHIEQYIIALYYTKYFHKFQFIHIYICSRYYNNYMSKIIFKNIKDYFNNIFCIIMGNFIKNRPNVYSSVILTAKALSILCKNIVLSNDNPYHTNDPNSCNEKIEICYGVINKTCYIPSKFNLQKKNNDIKIVTLWNDDIVKDEKCLYYFDQLPVYADNNHFSLFYLKTLRDRVIKIIFSNIRFSHKYMSDSKCKYYYLPITKYTIPNLNNEECAM